jgi:L-rhamnose mutarotase
LIDISSPSGRRTCSCRGRFDFDADAKKMLAHPAMKRWWEVCTPLQEALATRKPGEWWAMMQQVFFTDL